jgi:hypothetical protein
VYRTTLGELAAPELRLRSRQDQPDHGACWHGSQPVAMPDLRQLPAFRALRLPGGPACRSAGRVCGNAEDAGCGPVFLLHRPSGRDAGWPLPPHEDWRSSS